MDAHRTAELERARQETEGLSWQQQSWSGWPVLLRMLKPNLPLSLQLLPEHSVKMKTVKNYFDTLSSDSFDWGWEGIFNSISLTQSRFTTTGLWRCFLFYTKHLALVWRKKSLLRPAPGSGRGTAIRGEGKQKKKKTWLWGEKNGPGREVTLWKVKMMGQGHLVCSNCKMLYTKHLFL